MSPNETYACAVLEILNPSLVDHGRPNWSAIDQLQLIASTGERAMLDHAVDAWAGRGYGHLFAVIDRDKAARVLTALVHAYAQQPLF